MISFLGFIGVSGNIIFVTNVFEKAYSTYNTSYLYNILKSDIQFILELSDESIIYTDTTGYIFLSAYINKYGLSKLEFKLFNYKDIRKLKLQELFNDEF